MIVTCGVYIINSDKRILLTHPTKHSLKLWSIPKGQLNKNETFIDAAIREVREETNIILKKDQVIEILPNDFSIYKSNKKKLKGFYYISDRDMSNDNILCTSIVYPKNGRPFPENDKHGWATFEQALGLVHESQLRYLYYLRDLKLI